MLDYENVGSWQFDWKEDPAAPDKFLTIFIDVQKSGEDTIITYFSKR